MNTRDLHKTGDVGNIRVMINYLCRIASSRQLQRECRRQKIRIPVVGSDAELVIPLFLDFQGALDNSDKVVVGNRRDVLQKDTDESRSSHIERYTRRYFSK